MKTGVKSVRIPAQSYAAAVLYVVSFKGGGGGGVEINGGSRSCTLLSAHEGLWLLCALSADPSSLLATPMCHQWCVGVSYRVHVV